MVPLTTVHLIDGDCWDFLICLESLLLLFTYTEDVSNETAKSAASETVKIEVDDGKMESCLSRDKNRLTSLCRRRSSSSRSTVYRTYGIRRPQHEL
jgi:hypothetical protein